MITSDTLFGFAVLSMSAISLYGFYKAYPPLKNGERKEERITRVVAWDTKRNRPVLAVLLNDGSWADQCSSMLSDQSELRMLTNYELARLISKGDCDVLFTSKGIFTTDLLPR